MVTSDAGGPVRLPPSGGRGGRLLLATVVGLLGLLQVAIGVQVGRATTMVAGLVILGLAVSVGLGANRGASLGAGGLDIPGWPRGGEVPWSQVQRLVVRSAPFGRVQLRYTHTDHPAATSRPLGTLPRREAEGVLSRVRTLADGRDVPIHDER